MTHHDAKHGFAIARGCVPPGGSAGGDTGEGRREALREAARRDRPEAVLAAADLAAWARAEGPGSAAAAEAVRRRDPERWVPGLPARRTYKALGWAVAAVVVLDMALAWAPPSAGVEALDAWLRYGTAGGGVALAAWSLLSEMRGWEGSDAATWFAKRRIKRHARLMEARRLALRDTVLAIGEDRLVVWRDSGGVPTFEVLAGKALRGLALETGPGPVTLRLDTAAGTRSFPWLPRDPAFEAAVATLARERAGTAPVTAG